MSPHATLQQEPAGSGRAASLTPALHHLAPFPAQAVVRRHRNDDLPAIGDKAAIDARPAIQQVPAFTVLPAVR